ncbi:hypothetical protein CLAIMM_10374 isoform 3, partial [Cladophialophora immunda]
NSSSSHCTAFLQLGLDDWGRRLEYHRYVDLYRVRVTENQLKYLALTSCPAEHRVLASDCATFAFNFLVALLEHAKEQGLLSPDELLRQKKLLTKHNHTLEGSQGDSEASSRANPSLAESGHSAFASGMNIAALSQGRSPR